VAIVARYVQAFQKVPALKAKAPTQSEPSVIAQLGALALFVILSVVAAKRFRVEPARARV
jgi:hypothetical protein